MSLTFAPVLSDDLEWKEWRFYEGRLPAEDPVAAPLAPVEVWQAETL